MKTEKYHFKKWHLALILLGGTVIRFMYGYSSKAWLAAPDQLAWGLGLDEMVSSKTWRYIQLVHAPHEGASLLVSLMSLLFRPFQSIMPPLSFAALAIDTVSRLIQVKLTQKLFDDRTALFFGIWTILSVPLLIPWGTVNYGLHSLFSFIPFVFLYFIIKFRQNKYLPVVCGTLCGIAVSVSYDNVVLVMASVFFLVFISQTFTNGLYRVLVFFATFILAVLPHVLTRIYFDPAFSQSADISLSIRGVPLDNVFTQAHFINLATAWFTSLPGSFLLTSPGFLPAVLVCIVVSLFIFTGFIWYIRNKGGDKYLKILLLSVVALFVIAYAFSPFYGRSYHDTSYVYYRHWCYIIPLVTVIMINGFIHSGRLKFSIATVWIVLCGIASCQYIGSVQKIDQPVYRETGWVLAKKYRNNLGQLFQIHAIAEQRYQDELLFGFGWGLSAEICKNTSDQKAVETLVSIIRQCPASYQPVMIRGIYYSFGKGITPVLNQELPARLRSRFESNHEQK